MEQVKGILPIEVYARIRQSIGPFGKARGWLFTIAPYTSHRKPIYTRHCSRKPEQDEVIQFANENGARQIHWTPPAE